MILLEFFFCAPQATLFCYVGDIIEKGLAPIVFDTFILKSIVTGILIDSVWIKLQLSIYNYLSRIGIPVFN